jgi:acetyltransferase-like isoleucine patch superfamily enzyme
MVFNMKNESIEIRRKLLQFLAGNEKLFSFDVRCEPKDRIRFIYQINFPGFQKIKFYARFFIARMTQYIDYSPIKIFLYRMIGLKIGKGVFISPDVFLDPHFPSMIELGDYCILGWGAKFFAHEYSQGKYRVGRIVIKQGAIIGAFAVIRGGITIGENAEVPYGSTVYKDVPANTFASEYIKSHIRKKP